MSNCADSKIFQIEAKEKYRFTYICDKRICIKMEDPIILCQADMSIVTLLTQREESERKKGIRSIIAKG